MQNIKQKIKNTTLFSDEEKVDILAAIDTYSHKDVIHIEAIIDEYDISRVQAGNAYRTEVFNALDTIVKQAKPVDIKRIKNATENIRHGLDTILP